VTALPELSTLTDIELDVIFFIERFTSTNGVAPTRSQIDQRFTGLSDEWFAGFNANPLVQKSFAARGIVYPAMQDKLTDQQMHAIAVMLDSYDRRSDTKKLSDIGITTRQWSTWMLEEDFASYVRDRSERMLEGSIFEAHKGLVKGARNGNIAAVKTLYEITNRYRPDQEQQIDIRRVLHTFIEVIQRYVKDPVVLQHIAMDLSAVSTAESYANGLTNQMMSGAQNYQMRQVAGQTQSNLPMPASLDGGE
jgi:hypothetical protein